MEAAFPRRLAAEVRRAATGLAPASTPVSDQLIQDSYTRRWGDIVGDGGDVLAIPYRHYQTPLGPALDPGAELVRQAWLTRSGDGHLREAALRHLLAAPEPWHVPFVVQLCGEYVVEIGAAVADFADTLTEQDPAIVAAYREFWQNNPLFIALQQARVASYWDAYYRGVTSLADYPPRVALRGLGLLGERFG